MQKTVITYGFIGGAIVVGLWHATKPLWLDANGEMDMSKGELFGYINMVVALSMIFFGIRQYRERHLDGKISFGKAFKVGILITLVASAIYVIGWLIYYNTSDIAQNFSHQYLEHMKEQWAASGMSQAEIDQKFEGASKTMRSYASNPIIMVGMTLMEIFPVGLIISLISALILKKK